MSHSENHPVKSSDKSDHRSQGVPSRYHQTDGTRPDEQIRMRAYELYVEHGKQPGNAVADWLQAEREYHEQS